MDKLNRLKFAVGGGILSAGVFVMMCGEGANRSATMLQNPALGVAATALALVGGTWSVLGSILMARAIR